MCVCVCVCVCLSGWLAGCVCVCVCVHVCVCVYTDQFGLALRTLLALAAGRHRPLRMGQPADDHSLQLRSFIRFKKLF